MVVVVWIADGVWPAAVDAARAMATPDADFVLVHVTPGDVDWFSDFSPIVSNARLAGELARAGRARRRRGR